MENAGRGVYNVIKERFPELKGKKILVVAHHGNNGGDGFVAARYLADESETDVLFIGDEDKFKEEAEVNFKMIETSFPFFDLFIFTVIRIDIVYGKM